jgi:DNA-binding NtrC family response regulator
VVINCGAIPENLMESELFGHVRGAFTGAVATREGKFQSANKGTLFLDEIGELPVALQVKLLRALQERVVTKVGDGRPEKVDIRVIAATNRDLEEEIQRGAFRSDLYYRLNVIQLHLPPLRERAEDVPLLARHFLAPLGTEEHEPPTLAEETLGILARYDWPGNVRELENALERAAVLSPNRVITPASLPERVREAPKPRLAAEEAPSNPTMEVVERAYIQWVLQAEGGNKTRAAEVLGIDPSTLYRKLARYGIESS